jgi:elongation factor Ts
VVEVNSETDFVAKNDDFVAFTKEVAELIAKSNPADVDALGALAFRDSTVDTVRTGLIGKIGENITVRRFTRIATDNKVAQYVHGGRIGVLVEFSGDEALGKDLAMHIAATKPKALDTTGVSADDIQRERSVAEAKAAESGKPAEIVTKMVEGSIQKYLKEVTLLSQPFVKDDKQTVEQVLKSKGSSIQQFVLYVVGEGIEKKANDFAAEVAAQVAASKG